MEKINIVSESELRIKKIPIIGFFWEKSFFHYFWTGGLFTILNVFLLWLFIDVFHLPTVISSTIVIGGLFISRYVFYRLFKIM
ncbi:MAG: hypothetical protein RJA61_572 [Candidatus Parcubacteria bacterium]|jgi:putative flippase GtrA